MAGGSRGGILMAGLILIGIGALFMLQNWYGSFSAWRLMLRYWPVLLIIIGLRKIYCYCTWHRVPAVPDTEPKE